MAVPNIDTFEHDIAEEIKTKEASFTDIASAGGDIGNTAPPQSRTSNLLFMLGIFFIVLVLAGGGALLYFTSASKQKAEVAEEANKPAAPNLFSLSPALQDGIGQHVGELSKSEYGYTIKLVNFNPVYAYMLRNEKEFADDLAQAVGSPRDTTSTTSLPFSFTDITLSNQNMRIGTSGSSTVIYAFVNSQLLVISSTTEGILTLRNAILQR